MAAGPANKTEEDDDGMVDIIVTVDEPDTVEWLDSGDIRFRVDGSTWTLNAPKLGGVVWLLDVLGQYDAEVARLPQDSKRALAQIALVVKTLRKIFAKFSSDKLPAKDDDLPAMFANPNLLSQIAGHFRAIPLGSGS